MKLRALGARLPLVRCIRSLHVAGNHTAVPPDLRLLVLNELFRSFRSNDLLIPEDKQWGIASEVAVQIFERAAGGLGVEEVDYDN